MPINGKLCLPTSLSSRAAISWIASRAWRTHPSATCCCAPQLSIFLYHHWRFFYRFPPSCPTTAQQHIRKYTSTVCHHSILRTKTTYSVLVLAQSSAYLLAFPRYGWARESRAAGKPNWYVKCLLFRCFHYAMLYFSALIYKLNLLTKTILQLLRKIRLPPALIPRKPTAPQRCGLRLSTKRLNQRRLTPPYPHRKLYPVMTRRN